MLPGKPACGIIVPVCDEEPILRETVPRILSAASAVDARVLWICNGCRDGSAEVIRKLGGDEAEVIEIEERGKTIALQIGDDLLEDLFPRFYLDADVWLEARDLSLLLAILDSGRAELVSPRYTFDCSRASPASASIAKLWMQLPHAQHEGFHGLIGVSAAGRSHWNRWPIIICDDTFAASRVPSERRRIVPSARLVSRPPRDFSGWVTMRARWLAGQRELRRMNLSRPSLKKQRAALLQQLIFGPERTSAWLFLSARVLAGLPSLLINQVGWKPDRSP